MIKKLIARFPNDEELEKAFQAAKAKAIAEYTEYIPGHRIGLLGWGNGHFKNRPDIATAKVAARFPNGASDYLKIYSLNGAEARDLCLKVDLLIEAVNKLTKE